MCYNVFIDMDVKDMYYHAWAACYFRAVYLWRQKDILQLLPPK